MQGRQRYQPTLFTRGDLERYIPENHRLRKIDKILDLAHIGKLTENYYSKDQGRPSIDPELFFRMLIIAHLYGITSDRQLCEEIQVNLAYRWFLRLSLEDKVPDHSSLTKIRDRLGEKVFKEVFEHMVEVCQQKGFVKGEKLMVDGSLIEANASIDSLEKREDPEVYPYYWRKNPRYKNQTHKSRTDPESTLVGRMGHKNGLFYKSHYTIDGTARFITDCHVTTGSLHEALVLQDRLDYQFKRFGFKTKEVVADSGYSGAAHYEYLKNNEIRSYIPMRNSLGNKKDFQYDVRKDCYTCPEGKKLPLKITYKKTGMKVYKIEEGSCLACPIKQACTPQGSARTISRRYYEAEIEKIRRRMQTPYFKSKLYERMWKLEGLFAEAKLQHGLRRAKYRGKWKVQSQVYMIAFVQNLKRIAALDPQTFINYFVKVFKMRILKYFYFKAEQIA